MSTLFVTILVFYLAHVLVGGMGSYLRERANRSILGKIAKRESMPLELYCISRDSQKDIDHTELSSPVVGMKHVFMKKNVLEDGGSVWRYQDQNQQNIQEASDRHTEAETRAWVKDFGTLTG